MTDGPTGDVIHAVGRFTKCVDAAHYSNPISFGVGAGLASLGKDACDYIGGRKLVCLGEPRCVVGTIVKIEPVGYGKSGFELIDNDFCINLLLFPHQLERFNPHGGSSDKLANWDIVRHDQIQGELIDHDPSKMPTPNSPEASPTPYTVTYLFGGPDGPTPYEPNEDKTERVLEETKQDIEGIRRVEIPVFHCEFEGSRIFAVCSAIAPFLDIATGGPGGGACRAAIGWIPFLGDLICTIIETIITVALAPVIALAATEAWISAGLLDELAVTGPIARQVELGESVILTGRWAWDGGHSGWNELHATWTLQKLVLPEDLAGITPAEAGQFVEEWCTLAGQAPPTGEAAQGLGTMTPEQHEIYVLQQQPENTWQFHPSVDGCNPGQDEPPLPPIR